MKRQYHAALGALMATAPFFIATPKAVAQQAWKPTHEVTIVVPFTAGGGSDTAARALAQSLGKIWQQPVIVRNAPGADGAIGAKQVVAAKADGYTILLHQPTLSLMRHLRALGDFDPLANLTPVTTVVQMVPALAASGKVPVKNIDELIKHCKSAPTPCSIGTVTTTSKIYAKQLAAETGLNNLIVVSYRGASPMVTDVISNNVTMMFTSIAATLPFYNKELNVVATLGKERARALPDVPSIAEQGFSQFAQPSWNALFVPKGTPENVIDSIEKAVRTALTDSEVRKTILESGAEPVAIDRAQFTRQVAADDERLSKLLTRYPIQ